MRSIWCISIPRQAGRPARRARAFVVSPDAMHATGMAVVCPLTTTIHPQWAHRIQLTCASKPDEIMLGQILAVSIERFVKCVDAVKPADAEALRNLIALLYATP